MPTHFIVTRYPLEIVSFTSYNFHGHDFSSLTCKPLAYLAATKERLVVCRQQTSEGEKKRFRLDDTTPLEIQMLSWKQKSESKAWSSCALIVLYSWEWEQLAFKKGNIFYFFFWTVCFVSRDMINDALNWDFGSSNLKGISVERTFSRWYRQFDESWSWRIGWGILKSFNGLSSNCASNFETKNLNISNLRVSSIINSHLQCHESGWSDWSPNQDKTIHFLHSEFKCRPIGQM